MRKKLLITIIIITINISLPKNSFSNNAVEIAFMWFMEIYHNIISPQNGGQCRYTPTCSKFAEQSIKRFGFIKGSIIFGDRFLRCNPIGDKGYDPVPKRFIPKQEHFLRIFYERDKIRSKN
jgi:putative membrane protein insertion efficiency factor